MAEKKKNGRPQLITQELAEKVCSLIATHAKGLRGLHEMYDDFPSPRTIHSWIYKYPNFLRMYLQAKNAQSHVLLDNTIDISNENNEDNLIKINRHKLIIDTYKFNAVRLNRKDYGDAIKNEIVTDKTEAIKDRELVQKCMKKEK